MHLFAAGRLEDINARSAEVDAWDVAGSESMRRG